MDNLCHTLAGAAMGEAGLKSRTRFATPALLIAANLPDVDILVYASSAVPVSFRRGWTHGVVAQALLPLLLAGLLLLWDRWRPAGDLSRARAGGLLAIGYAGVLSHVLLDYLNNYGVRLLMPFSSRWFYGDTLFIIDLWLWLMLGAGVYVARRRGPRKHQPVWYARRALAAAALYILAMLVSARASRQIVLDSWLATHGSAPAALMVGPRPVTPFSKTIIVDAGDHFRTGTFSWLPPRVRLEPARLPNRLNERAVRRASEDPTLRAVLGWSRFPYFEETDTPDGRLVTFTDLRFGARVGRTTVLVQP